MPEDNDNRRLSGREKTVLTAVTILFLALALAASFYMLKNRPKPERRKPPKKDLQVTVQELHASSRKITVPVLGTVIPAVQVDLKTRVSGEVTWTNPNLIEGGLISRGEALVKIDRSDYELALTGKRANLEQAKYELAVEQGKQDIAKREWELLDLEKEASELDRELALRKPHLREKLARLKAAEADVKKASLDLERTTVKAPFNSIVRTAGVNVGDQASVQTVLANLVGTDSYWIQVSLPVDQLKWINLPGVTGKDGSPAQVTTSTGRVREGKVLKLFSDLEPEGRLARLLVEVPDPIDLKNPEGERSPMLLGEYVRINIEGLTVDDVFSIPQRALRDGNEVWTVDSGNHLKTTMIDIVWKDRDTVLARGLSEDSLLILTDIPAPVEGMKLMPISPQNKQDDTEDPGGGSRK